MAQDLNGRVALVTGASSGLGADFARQLAACGASVVLVARREDRLRALADELAGRGATAHVLAADLASEAGRAALFARIADLGLDIDILINNAGFGVHGEFLACSWESQRGMIDLDVLGLLHLTHHFAAGMVERRRGWILQVASIGAYQPTPTYATYAAAKSFVLYFSQALAAELRPAGVTVSVLSPGVTATEFLAVAGQAATFYQRSLMMRSDVVVRAGLRGLWSGRLSVVPGLLNWLAAVSVRFLPARLAAWIAGRSMTVG